MHARTGTLQVSPGRVDDMVSRLEADQLPRYRDQHGYKGFTVLADRVSGKVIGISYWETEDDMEASEQLGRSARSQAAEAGEASAEPVRETYEVVIDEMV
jgi:heme-degrading monooxygenase HmoA